MNQTPEMALEMTYTLTRTKTNEWIVTIERNGYFYTPSLEFALQFIKMHAQSTEKE